MTLFLHDVITENITQTAELFYIKKYLKFNIKHTI